MGQRGSQDAGVKHYCCPHVARTDEVAAASPLFPFPQLLSMGSAPTQALCSTHTNTTNTIQEANSLDQLNCRRRRKR
jgi:hypothetical protein